MKRKLLKTASWLCAALMASFAVGCSSSRKTQKEAEVETAGDTIPQNEELKDSSEVVAPLPDKDDMHRVRVLYGVRNMEFQKLEEER